jgi:hypothetical protein
MFLVDWDRQNRHEHRNVNVHLVQRTYDTSEIKTSDSIKQYITFLIIYKHVLEAYTKHLTQLPTLLTSKPQPQRKSPIEADSPAMRPHIDCLEPITKG